METRAREQKEAEGNSSSLEIVEVCMQGAAGYKDGQVVTANLSAHYDHLSV